MNSRHAVVKHKAFGNFSCQRKLSLVEKHPSYEVLTAPHLTTSLTSHITHISHLTSHLPTSPASHITHHSHPTSHTHIAHITHISPHHPHHTLLTSHIPSHHITHISHLTLTTSHITHISHISPHVHVTSHITFISHLTSHLTSHITHISHLTSHLTTSLRSHIKQHPHLTSQITHHSHHSHLTSHHISHISHLASLTSEASKTSVSCETSCKFHARSWQNARSRARRPEHSAHAQIFWCWWRHYAAPATKTAVSMHRNAAPATQSLFPAQWAKMSTAPQREHTSGKPSVSRETSSPKATLCETSHGFITIPDLRQNHRTPQESTRITTKNAHRRSWRAGNYENYLAILSTSDQTPRTPDNCQEKWTSKKLKGQKLRELPRKTRTRPPPPLRKDENYHDKWTSKKLKSREVGELPCKTRSRPSQTPRKYENYC